MDASRRSLLKGNFHQLTYKIKRLPWLTSLDDFLDQCTQCGECISACETGIIRKDLNQFPAIDFSNNECTFCAKCVQVCDQLMFVPVTANPWNYVATIKESCLTNSGVVCSSCKEACDYDAISIHYEFGQVPKPIVNSEACRGCGACESACPNTAIEIFSETEISTAEEPTS